MCSSRDAASRGISGRNSNDNPMSRKDRPFRGYGRDHYYDVGRRLLSMIGQWPYQKAREKLLFTIVVVVCDASIIVTQVAQLLVCESTQCIFETLSPHMLAVIILVKILTYQFNGRKIKDLTDRLFLDWDTLESQQEREIMERYAENGRRYTVVYASYVYASTLSFITTSLAPRILDLVVPLNNSRPIMLGYPAYYFVDEEQYFYYIFSHALLSTGISMTGLIAHDCMFLIYVEHVCGLFGVVGFAALLENTFSLSFAVQIAIVTIGMSITLIQVSLQLHDPTEAMRYLVFVVAQLFHLFCLSLQGQKLINHSLGTYEKIYNGSWYEIPVKSQKLLLFVMRKSAETSSLTAGKIYVFSLASFTTVVQSSVSYFTMLLSFNQP